MLVQGHIQANKAFPPAVAELINRMADTPRLARDSAKIGNQFGYEGAYYTESEQDSVLTPLRPPLAQPSMELDWTVSPDGTELHYRAESESLVHMGKWLYYIIQEFCQRDGILLNGAVILKAQEEEQAVLHLHVVNNQIDYL